MGVKILERKKSYLVKHSIIYRIFLNLEFVNKQEESNITQLHSSINKFMRNLIFY